MSGDEENLGNNLCVIKSICLLLYVIHSLCVQNKLLKITTSFKMTRWSYGNRHSVAVGKP